MILPQLNLVVTTKSLTNRGGMTSVSNQLIAQFEEIRFLAPPVLGPQVGRSRSFCLSWCPCFLSLYMASLKGMYQRHETSSAVTLAFDFHRMP